MTSNPSRFDMGPWDGIADFGFDPCYRLRVILLRSLSYTPMSGADETWFGLRREAKHLVFAGSVLGLGLGGFFDGIVFHQILQLHNMATSHPDPAIADNLELNVMLDGLFHSATYLFTVLGVSLLWRAWRIPRVPSSGQTLFGSVILGWGIFNVVEGIVDHHLLGIHHVWPDGPGSVLLWDVAFLVWGALFIIGGYVIIQRDDAVAPIPEEESDSEQAISQEGATEQNRSM